MTPAQMIVELPKSHGWSLIPDAHSGLLITSQVTEWFVRVRLDDNQSPRERAQTVCEAAWVSLSMGCAQRNRNTGRDYNRLLALIELVDSELWLQAMVEDRERSTRLERIVGLLRRLAPLDPLRFGSEYAALVGLELGDPNSPWFDFVCHGDMGKVADALLRATEPVPFWPSDSKPRPNFGRSFDGLTTDGILSVQRAEAAYVTFKTASGTEFLVKSLTFSGMRVYEAYGLRLEVRPHNVRLVDENGIVHEALTVPEAARSSLLIRHSPDRPSRRYDSLATLETWERYAPMFGDVQATLQALDSAPGERPCSS